MHQFDALSFLNILLPFVTSVKSQGSMILLVRYSYVEYPVINE